MATLTRFTADLVTQEALSERRVEIISRQLTEYLHTLIVEDDDRPHLEVDKNAHGHVHDTADGDRCGYCLEESRDYRNGDSVVNA
jgi:hypothetical protein